MKFRLLNVLQHHSLAALLLHHTFIIGQVIGGSLDAMAAVSRTEDFVYHPNGRAGP